MSLIWLFFLKWYHDYTSLHSQGPSIVRKTRVQRCFSVITTRGLCATARFDFTSSWQRILDCFCSLIAEQRSTARYEHARRRRGSIRDCGLQRPLTRGLRPVGLSTFHRGARGTRWRREGVPGHSGAEPTTPILPFGLVVITPACGEGWRLAGTSQRTYHSTTEPTKSCVSSVGSSRAHRRRRLGLRRLVAEDTGSFGRPGGVQQDDDVRRAIRQTMCDSARRRGETVHQHAQRRQGSPARSDTAQRHAQAHASRNLRALTFVSLGAKPAKTGLDWLDSDPNALKTACWSS